MRQGGSAQRTMQTCEVCAPQTAWMGSAQSQTGKEVVDRWGGPAWLILTWPPCVPSRCPLASPHTPVAGPSVASCCWILPRTPARVGAPAALAPSLCLPGLLFLELGRAQVGTPPWGTLLSERHLTHLTPLRAPALYPSGQCAGAGTHTGHGCSGCRTLLPGLVHEALVLGSVLALAWQGDWLSLGDPSPVLAHLPQS